MEQNTLEPITEDSNLTVDKFGVVHVKVYNEWSTYYLIDGQWREF